MSLASSAGVAAAGSFLIEKPRLAAPHHVHGHGSPRRCTDGT